MQGLMTDLTQRERNKKEKDKRAFSLLELLEKENNKEMVGETQRMYAKMTLST